MSPGRGLPEDERDPPASVIRHEQELLLSTTTHEAGMVRLRKAVDSGTVEEVVPRDIEHAEIERVNPGEEDSGEILTLPDGSVSVPVFEEELVITKRVVVRERVIIRKHVTTERDRVKAELQSERVSIETSGDVQIDDELSSGMNDTT